MKKVSKEEFFKSFDQLQGVTTGCAHDHRVWEVRHRGAVIARAIKDDEADTETFYIKEKIS